MVTRIAIGREWRVRLSETAFEGALIDWVQSLSKAMRDEDNV